MNDSGGSSGLGTWVSVSLRTLRDGNQEDCRILLYKCPCTRFGLKGRFGVTPGPVMKPAKRLASCCNATLGRLPPDATSFPQRLGCNPHRLSSQPSRLDSELQSTRQPPLPTRGMAVDTRPCRLQVLGRPPRLLGLSRSSASWVSIQVSGRALGGGAV